MEIAADPGTPKGMISQAESGCKMLWELFIVVLACAVVAVGCNRTESTSTPIDLSAYGIPGGIDLPPGFQITQQGPSQVAIDRDDRVDDPFELRILPCHPGEIPLEVRRKSLKEDEPYEFVVEEAEGFAAWQRNKNRHPMADHKVEVYREVMLENQKYVACVYIDDFRADRQLVERVWKAAKSLRSK